MIGCQTSSPSDYRFKQPEKKRWATRLSYLIAIGALSLVELLMFIVGSACNAAESTFESFEFPDFHDGKIVILGDTAVFAGTEVKSVGDGTVVEVPHYRTLDLRTRKLLSQSLQPVTSPQASGKGLNISREGSCAVGYQDSGFFTFSHAFRWTESTGPVDLGTLDPPNNASRSSYGTDANQDCSVVVGASNTTSDIIEHAFRWTQNGGMVDLGAPAGAGSSSRALGVSSNGTVIVGDAEFPAAGGTTRSGAFRWTGGTFQDLGSLEPNSLSLATGVSGDGTVIVGWSGITTASRAFRWTTQTQTMQPIGPLPGHLTAAATAVSDNGKIVVGISHPTFLQFQGVGLSWNQGTAFRWTQAKGIQELRQVFIDNGVDMTGVSLVSVTGMSPDGQWIGGDATTAQTGPGEIIGFLAQVCDADIGGPCKNATGAIPFTLGVNPNQLNVSAGQSASTTITVIPDAGFTQPVNFSCGGLPVGAGCSFNPMAVTPSGGPVNTTLTVSTNGGPVARLSSSASPTMFAYVMTPFVLIPIGMLIRRRGSDRRLLSIVTGCLVTLTLLGTLSCSSSDSPPPATNSSGGVPATGTPAGTSIVTVTASSGSGSSGVPVTLNVTR